MSVQCIYSSINNMLNKQKNYFKGAPSTSFNGAPSTTVLKEPLVQQFRVCSDSPVLWQPVAGQHRSATETAASTRQYRDLHEASVNRRSFWGNTSTKCLNLLLLTTLVCLITPQLPSMLISWKLPLYIGVEYIYPLFGTTLYMFIRYNIFTSRT